jgi:large subunit ribosomal protein L32e
LTEERQSHAKLAEKRAKEKKKKPKFRRQESWRYGRLRENWRKPRGLDNKVRRKVKGWPSAPESGYRGPKGSRGLHPSSFMEVRVFNVDDLAEVNPEIQAVRIAHTVGARKRMEILDRAKEMGVRVLNPREFRELEGTVGEKEG